MGGSRKCLTTRAYPSVPMAPNAEAVSNTFCVSVRERVPGSPEQTLGAQTTPPPVPHICGGPEELPPRCAPPPTPTPKQRYNVEQPETSNSSTDSAQELASETFGRWKPLYMESERRNDMANETHERGLTLEKHLKLARSSKQATMQHRADKETSPKNEQDQRRTHMLRRQ